MKSSTKRLAWCLTALALVATGVFYLAPVNTSAKKKSIGKYKSKIALNKLGVAGIPGTGTGAIPDNQPGTPLEISFDGSGLSGDVESVGIDMTVNHSWVGDLEVTLVSPAGTEHTIMSRTGSTSGTGAGDSSDLDGTYGFNDGATGDWWAEAAAQGGAAALTPGDYRTTANTSDVATELDTTYAGEESTGTWVLRTTDNASGDTGDVTAANLYVTVAASTPPVLNEVVSNPSSSDQPCEYYEIKGAPGSTLTDTFVIAVEGDGGGAGIVDYVFDLSGQTIGTNGILVVTGTNQCGSRVYPMATTVVQDPQLDSSNGFENGSLSVLLVQDTTLIAEDTDLDTDNDGTPESFPATATILDAVGWTDGGGSDLVYGGVMLTQASGGPDAATRFPDNTDPSSFDAWYNGDLVDDGNGNATVTYDVGNDVSANFPLGGMLTPGDVNVGGSTFAPQAPGNDFDGDGSTDYAVVRGTFDSNPRSNVKSLGGEVPGEDFGWWVFNSSNGAVMNANFGTGGHLGSSDRITPADFDGDGTTDIAVWRGVSSGQPSGNGFFFWVNSSDSTVSTVDFGQFGDNPAIVGDYDGDGTADPAVFRCSAVPSVGFNQCTFFYQASSGSGITFVPWGSTETFVRPYPGDFDGDGKFDFVVHRGIPSVVNAGGEESGQFAILRSSDGVDEYVNWGTTVDALIPGDFDGDGRSDYMAGRVNGDGNLEWWLFTASGDSSVRVFGTTNIPNTEELAAPGDYDGDGATDIAVYRRDNSIDNSNYFVLRSSDDALQSFEWGNQMDVPAQGWNVQFGN